MSEKQSVEAAEPPVSKPPDRWFGPQGSARFHYFDSDLRSLCRKWMLWRDPEQIDGLGWGVAQGNATGDCAACTKKLAALTQATLSPPESDFNSDSVAGTDTA